MNMQDLLARLLGRSPEIDEAADQLCQTMPGYQEAKQAYDALADQIRALAGCDLYDRYFSRLMQYSNYEVSAYYSLGLGLRKDIVQALEV